MSRHLNELFEYTELELKVIELLGMEPPFGEEEFNKMSPDTKTEKLFLAAEQHYKSRKMKGIGKQVIEVAARHSAKDIQESKCLFPMVRW
jgi:hypothetical protein